MVVCMFTAANAEREGKKITTGNEANIQHTA
jgi:hypothetical protein